MKNVFREFAVSLRRELINDTGVVNSAAKKGGAIEIANRIEDNDAPGQYSVALRLIEAMKNGFGPKRKL
jgi:hypothetical protein